MSGIHLVLGNGTVGSKLATRLARSGKQVLVLSRSAERRDFESVTALQADATSLSTLLAVAPEANFVYNCINPPYDKWDSQWPPLNKTVNEYVIKTGAVLITCSNLYGYGPHDGVLTEELPQRATWKNGRVRAQMWAQVKSLHDEGKLIATEVRASDYICPSGQSRMGDRVVPRLLAGKSVQLLGALDRPHTWTDPDDVAALMAVVAEDSRAWGNPWHVPSNEPKTQAQVIVDIAREIGFDNPKVSTTPTVIEKLIGVFNPVIKELSATGYQFNAPFIMSDEKARKTFGLSPKPWKEMIRDLVASYPKSS